MSAVVHYVGHDGEDYFDQWLRARIQTRIDRIELGTEALAKVSSSCAATSEPATGCTSDVMVKRS